MDSHFEDPGYLQIGNFTLHDNESEATGDHDLTGAFALSSNVDFAQIALKMGVDHFYDYLGRWGIGASLDFQLPAEPTAFRRKTTIVPGELAQMAFGQGALLVTPLQMALIAATIANGGTSRGRISCARSSATAKSRARRHREPSQSPDLGTNVPRR